MRIKLISELKSGDLFIWGSDDTRRRMVVSGENLGLLICAGLESVFFRGDHVGKVKFLPKSCNETFRWYGETDIALVADSDDLHSFVHKDVGCQSCGGVFAGHYKLECRDGGYFIPNQADLEALHPAYKIALRGEDRDFFDSIGL